MQAVCLDPAATAAVAALVDTLELAGLAGLHLVLTPEMRELVEAVEAVVFMVVAAASGYLVRALAVLVVRTYPGVPGVVEGPLDHQLAAGPTVVGHRKPGHQAGAQSESSGPATFANFPQHAQQTNKDHSWNTHN